MDGPLLFLGLLALTFATGRVAEQRHLRDLARREERARRLLVTTCQAAPGSRGAAESALVMGSVVVSVDYFRRLVEAVRSAFGGRLGAYERALARARREALLRMREAAMHAGYRQVVAVRIETAQLASARRGNERTSGLEILAFGTALRSTREGGGGRPPARA